MHPGYALTLVLIYIIMELTISGRGFIMQFLSRGNTSPQGIPKVYFTGHPADCKAYFKSISEQLLKLHNCAVFYDEDPERPEDMDNFYSDIDRMQLIVIVVTGRYVYQDTFAHQVFQYAVKHHKPVLPILEESGIESDFNKKCGDLQFLNPNSTDVTEISYEEKLKKFLDSILVKDELAEKIRKAFDAYVFLSYRKKDRKYAQQLMRLIHSNAFCRDIAIWYDEFLVPGENFNQAIAAAMEKSELFALVITPSLLEEPNYVMTTEYPAAREQDKKILPVMLSPTDSDQMKKHYEGIPEAVDPSDRETLADALRTALANVARQENDAEPQHVFFIGLAYLAGIDVEVDHERAVEMITFAAEQELPEAIEKLVSMHRTGEGVKRSYETAIVWQRKLVDLRKREFEQEQSEKNGSAWISELWQLGDFLFELGQTSEAEAAYQGQLAASEQYAQLFDTTASKKYLSGSYNKLGGMCEAHGNLSGARTYYEKSVGLMEKLDATQAVLNDLSHDYTRLGTICQMQGDLASARTYFNRSVFIGEFLAKGTDSVGVLRNLSLGYVLLGGLYQMQELDDNAFACYEKSRVICETLAERTGSVRAQMDLVTACNSLGQICRMRGEIFDAKKWYEKSIAISKPLVEEQMLLEAMRDLMIAYGGIGAICARVKAFSDAKAYYENALSISKQLAERVDTVEAQRDLAISYEQLGRVCDQQGDYQGAKSYYEPTLSIRQHISQQTNSVVAQRDLSDSYISLGDIAERLGDYEAERQYYEKGYAIREALAELLKTADAYDALAVASYKLACALPTSEERRPYLIKAGDIWISLAKQLPHVPLYAKRMELVKQIFNI